MDALGTGGETLWSKRRGAEDRFVNSLILHNGCGKKADKADNAFGGIHQSGQFPNASDLGYPSTSFVYHKLGENGNYMRAVHIYNRCQL